MRTRKIAIALLTFGALLGPAAKAPAADAPAWHLTLTPFPTNFAPGAVGNSFKGPFFRLAATNVGGAPTSGPISLSVTLPPGLTPVSPVGDGSSGSTSPAPTCEANGQTVTCEGVNPVHPGRWLGARVPLEVTGSPGVLEPAEAIVSGGNAEAVTTSYQAEISPDPAGFSFLDGTTGLSALLTGRRRRRDPGGSHPDQLTVSLAFQPSCREHAQERGHHATFHRSAGGFVVNPGATSVLCSEAELLSGSSSEPGCRLLAGGHDLGDDHCRRPDDSDQRPVQHGALAGCAGPAGLQRGQRRHLRPPRGSVRATATTASRPPRGTSSRSPTTRS